MQTETSISLCMTLSKKYVVINATHLLKGQRLGTDILLTVSSACEIDVPIFTINITNYSQDTKKK